METSEHVAQSTEESPVSRLCEKCSGVSTNWPWLLEGVEYTDRQLASSSKHTYRHYTELAEIADSADRGCALCIQLLSSSLSHNLRILVWIEGDLEAGVMRLVRHENNGFLLSVNVCCCTSGWGDIDPYDHDNVGLQWEFITLLVNLMPVDRSSSLFLSFCVYFIR